MFRDFRVSFASLLFLLPFSAWSALAQTQDNGTASLREVHVDGQKHLSEAQIAALTGLVAGTQVGRSDLQAAADRLVQTGLFSKVSYNFETRVGVVATYHVEESP